MPTIEQLVTLAQVSLLEAGGVEDWDWYNESLENYGYVKSDDEFEDAENFLEALRQGGVTNWDWYGDSIAGLDEYEAYLESLPNLDDALDVMSWKEMEKDKTSEVPVAPVVEVVVEKRKPVGVAEETLFAHIANKFGADRAEEVYDLAVEKGIWKQTTFPKEFKKALKVIVKGVVNPLEVARQALVASVIKNGKLDVFLDEIVAGEGGVGR
jgi:hypothetical protein